MLKNPACAVIEVHVFLCLQNNCTPQPGAFALDRTTESTTASPEQTLVKVKPRILTSWVDGPNKVAKLFVGHQYGLPKSFKSRNSESEDMLEVTPVLGSFGSRTWKADPQQSSRASTHKLVLKATHWWLKGAPDLAQRATHLTKRAIGLSNECKPWGSRTFATPLQPRLMLPLLFLPLEDEASKPHHGKAGQRQVLPHLRMGPGNKRSSLFGTWTKNRPNKGRRVERSKASFWATTFMTKTGCQARKSKR